jgi:AraC family transcriptional activator of pobA
VKQKDKNSIPVYDIYSLSRDKYTDEDLTVNPLAPYLEAHPHLYYPHRHSFYHLIFFTKGTGTHTIDFEHFKVAPGQIYFMIPGQVHSWSFGGDMQGYAINFSENILRTFAPAMQSLDVFPFFRGVAQESVIALSAKAQKEATAIIKNMLAEIQEHNIFNKDMVRSYLVSLFISVSRDSIDHAGDHAPLQNQLILNNFKKLVEQDYKQKHLPKDYATVLYITPNHLNALCKDLVGKSAGEIIRDRILLESKRLLVNMNMGIAEIAYELNFTDNSYFTKFFKKYTGVTPEEFRKSSLSNAAKQ